MVSAAQATGVVGSKDFLSEGPSASILVALMLHNLLFSSCCFVIVMAPFFSCCSGNSNGNESNLGLVRLV